MNDTPPDLQAICDGCLTVITDGEGNVWTDRHIAEKTSRKARGEDTSWMDDEPLADATDALTVGEAGVTWHVTHTGCAPVMPSWAYAIPVERITTWPAVLHWTAHLMDKGWLAATDWSLLLLKTVEPQRASVSGLRPIRPQDIEFRGIGS
ncbi:hypothetical protein ABT076_10730 [Streptomyces sp. NPDC002131]|uniref:hypothetical protein n=1 Tax=Streptomyces sp. NPDC002131 TaxID=3154535 RepID=UPI00331CFC1F